MEHHSGHYDPLIVGAQLHDVILVPGWRECNPDTIGCADSEIFQKPGSGDRLTHDPVGIMGCHPRANALETSHQSGKRGVMEPADLVRRLADDRDAEDRSTVA